MTCEKTNTGTPVCTCFTQPIDTAGNLPICSIHGSTGKPKHYIARIPHIKVVKEKEKGSDNDM